jgi:hypothetical protein
MMQYYGVVFMLSSMIDHETLLKLIPNVFI